MKHPITPNMTKSRFRNINNANAEIDRLNEVLQEYRNMLDAAMDQRHLMAMLAARTPQFDTPLVAMEAERLRDAILSKSPRTFPQYLVK